MDPKSALVAGASGLIGNELIHLLLKVDYYDKIIAIVRRKLDIKHPKLAQIIVDFDRLEEEKIQVNHVYCCLGTTMKKAGSKEAFYKVDYTYTLKLAEMALQNGADQFLLVSAMGANKDAKLFYNRVKGEIELALCSLSYKAINIFRPSLLLGRRNEARMAENIVKFVSRFLSFVLIGPFKKYKPIKVSTLARGMYKIARQELSGVFLFESHKIKLL